MRISFGKLIPVRVFVDGKETDDRDEVSKVTNTLCANLRRQKHYPNTHLIEQQRRMFNAVVSDYELPRTDDDYKGNKSSPSYVHPVYILNPNTGKKERYLATGKHVAAVKEIGHQYGSDLKIHGDEEKANIYRQYKLNELKNATGVTLKQTLCVNAITNPDAKLDKEKYRITLIDFQA